VAEGETTDRIVGRIEGVVIGIKEDVVDIKTNVKDLGVKLDTNTEHTIKNSKDIQWITKKSMITGGVAGTGGAGLLAFIIMIAKKWLTGG